jgi:hypothetical protein
LVANPIRVKHASSHVNKYQYYSQKGDFQGILKNDLGPEAELEPESEPEQQFGFTAPWSQSRKKYFQFNNTAFFI